MSNEIRFLESTWTLLREHVLSDGDEHGAILICGSTTRDNKSLLTVRDLIPLTDDDMLTRSALHLSIDPISLARAAKRARYENSTVIVCHSHPFPGGVRPSPLDLDTEAELCGRALLARLTPRPVGSLIVGPDGVSARVYRSVTAEAARVSVVSKRGINSIAGLSRVGEEVFAEHDRQVRAWGLEGQRKIAGARCIVVGAGGTGSQVAQQLAHLGVRRVTVMDPDRVEATNLPRIVGSCSTDIGAPKVDVLARLIGQINPDAQVERIQRSVLDIDPAIFAFADVVFCCTDGHGSRALLSDLCQRYLLPVIDMGVELVAADSAVMAGGGVRVLLPGAACLQCLGTLDSALVREEYLTDEQRDHERRHGYLRGATDPTPSVICLNGVVASLAVVEFCHIMAGMFTRGSSRLLYRAHERAVTTATSRLNPGCHICGENGVVGEGDAGRPPTRWPGDTHPAEMTG